MNKRAFAGWRSLSGDVVADLIEKHRVSCTKDTETFTDDGLYAFIRDVCDQALPQIVEINYDLVDKISDEVGVGRAAWDTVDPLELIKAVLKHALGVM